MNPQTKRCGTIIKGMAWIAAGLLLACRQGLAQPQELQSGAAELKAAKGPGFSDDVVSFETDLRPRAGSRPSAAGLRYAGGKLVVRMHTHDNSTIIDLGRQSFDTITELPQQKSGGSFAAEAAAGHLYLIHRLSDYDYFVLLRVAELTPAQSCKVEWVRLDQRADRLMLGAAAAQRIGEMLRSMAKHIDPADIMALPRVVLQIRAGAGGGNPNRLTMLGNTTAHVRSVSSLPLSFAEPVSSRERSATCSSGPGIRD
jgi:hypothetical protein